MSKQTFFFSTLYFLVLFSSNMSFAYTGFAVCNYGKQTVDSVICFKPTVMKGTIVKGDIKVTGTLTAENISARNLMVEGNANLSHFFVGGITNVTGNFTADTGEFKNGIAIVGSDITLKDSKVNGMVTITSKDNQPYLRVICGSVITGAVLFDGKAGIVQITGDSLVQGKVVNGAMEFIKEDCK